MQTILHVEKIGQVSSFFSRLMPTEFCFPPSFLMEKLFNPCVIRRTCLLTTTKETRKLPTYQFEERNSRRHTVILRLQEGLYHVNSKIK